LSTEVLVVAARGMSVFPHVAGLLHGSLAAGELAADRRMQEGKYSCLIFSVFSEV
jgi:hypothetical protein